MLSVGIDLAAEPAKTAVAWIDWSGTDARVTEIVCEADDDRLAGAIDEADKAGIDCPLGWPDGFVEFVSAHQSGHAVVPEQIGGKAWRRSLAYRYTDVVVREATGFDPLSVATDKIGLTAMRCAGLLARLALAGRPVDRAGVAAVVEVYPAASLKLWGLRHRGYKGSKRLVELGILTDELLAAAPWLSLGRFRDLCLRSDDAFDSVVAALTARAAATGRTRLPGSDHLDAARREGWIALPITPLHDLEPREHLSGGAPPYPTHAAQVPRRSSR